MDIQDKSNFVSKAEKSGWMPLLVEELINVCGGFNSFLEVADIAGENVFDNVSNSLFNTIPKNQLSTDPLIVLNKSTVISELSLNYTTIIYEKYFDQIAKSLWMTSNINNYDRYQAASDLAPNLPYDFLPYFWRGYGNDLLKNNFRSKLSSEQLCHYVILYAIYMLIYELETQLERLEKPWTKYFYQNPPQKH